MSNFIDKINLLEDELKVAKDAATKATSELETVDDKLLLECEERIRRSATMNSKMTEFREEFAYMQQHDNTIATDRCSPCFVLLLEDVIERRRQAVLVFQECTRTVQELKQRLGAERDALVAARVAQAANHRSDNGDNSQQTINPLNAESPLSPIPSGTRDDFASMLRCLIVSMGGLEHKIDHLSGRLTTVEDKVATVQATVETLRSDVNAVKVALSSPPGGSIAGHKGAGYSPGTLKAAGYPAAALKAVDYTAGDLKPFYDITALKEAAYSPRELLDGGYSAKDIKKAGFSIADCVAAQCSLGELKTAEHYFSEWDAAGFSVGDLKAAGYSASELWKVGCHNAGKLRSAGYSLREMLDGGFALRSLVSSAGYSLRELKAAGLTAKDVYGVFNLNDIKSAGYTYEDFCQCYGTEGAKMRY